jgi:predicted nucleotide-binding protein (sugar kinase/HSP70/actin superfamily)
MNCSMPGQPIQDFSTLFKRVGRLDVSGKTVLVPRLDRFASHLLAASLRAFGVQSVVMDSFKELENARQHISGKECFPCHVTLGDLLNHLKTEQKKLGARFSPGNYVYFLPTSSGPCRFGMYNKLQRIALDSYPEFRNVGISCLSADDAYSASGFVRKRYATAYRKLTFMSLIIGDVLNRITWRARPYETVPGITDNRMDSALDSMIRLFEDHGSRLNFKPMYGLLKDTAGTISATINFSEPRRPRIAIVGEIYLRNHDRANQDIARQIEHYGGEVVVSSITEWTHYVTCRLAGIYRTRVAAHLKNMNITSLPGLFGALLQKEAQKMYLSRMQAKTYRHVMKHLDIQPDIDIRLIDKKLKNGDHYRFILGSEAPVTIGSALMYADSGFDGIINMYPFGCMPGNTSSVILKPLFRNMNMPFIEISCDGTYQPNRETVLRTFMHQVRHKKSCK